MKPTMAERITVNVPDLGDFHDVEVIEVLVKAGDTIAADTPLITLETDKATMDVPSTAADRTPGVFAAASRATQCPARVACWFSGRK